MPETPSIRGDAKFIFDSLMTLSEQDLDNLSGQDLYKLSGKKEVNHLLANLKEVAERSVYSVSDKDFETLEIQSFNQLNYKTLNNVTSDVPTQRIICNGDEVGVKGDKSSGSKKAKVSSDSKLSHSVDKLFNNRDNTKVITFLGQEAVCGSINDFNECDLFEKMQVLENSGFVTVPVSGKFRYTGSYTTIMNRGRRGRLRLFNRIEVSKHYRYIDYLKYCMDAISYTNFQAGLSSCDQKWPMVDGSMQNHYKEYRNQDGIAVVMKSKQVCLDIDTKDTYLLGVLQALIPKALVVSTPRGYHVYATDNAGQLKNIVGLVLSDDGRAKIEVKGYRQTSVFASADNGYKLLSGSFDAIGDIGEDFTSRLGSSLDFIGGQFIMTAEDVKKKSSAITDGVLVDNSEQIPFINVGERNNVLFRKCFSWKAKGYTVKSIEQKLRSVNSNPTIIEAPISESEIKALVRHVVRKPDRSDFVRYYPLYSRGLK